jgi:hypothetical protein
MARGWPSFSPRAWRKSSQWFAVTRSHARLFLEDTVVDAVFRRVCYDRGWDDELKGCGAAPGPPCGRALPGSGTEGDLACPSCRISRESCFAAWAAEACCRRGCLCRTCVLCTILC